jgi:hypothetical protein
MNIRKLIIALFHHLKYFFERDHIIKAIWSFVIAILLLIIGMVISPFRQPSKVEIVNYPRQFDTVCIKDNPNERLCNLVEQLTLAINQQSNSDKNIKTTKSDSTKLSTNPKVGTKKHFLSYNSTALSSVNQADIDTSKFALPPENKGYTQANLSSLMKISVPQLKIMGDTIFVFYIEPLENSLISKISPLFVDFLRKDSEHLFTQIISQRYRLRNGKNMLRLSITVPPGIYRLGIGFYFLNEISGKYPKKYVSKYDIDVLK